MPCKSNLQGFYYVGKSLGTVRKKNTGINFFFHFLVILAKNALQVWSKKHKMTKKY